jgi:hypothetical protein
MKVFTSMPEIAPTPNRAPTRCSATTKAGKGCKAYAVEGSTLCRAHGMTEAERRELIETGVRARQSKAQARRDAVEARRMGLQALLGQRLEARAERVAEVLDGMLDHEDTEVQRKGLELWLNRVYGRAVQPTQELAPDLPQDVEAVRAMSPEERRALLRTLPPQG